MHFEPIDRFDNARCVTVCDSVKDQSIPNRYSSNLYVYISTQPDQPDFKSIIDQLLRNLETSKIRINHNVTLTYSVIFWHRTAVNRARRPGYGELK